MFSSSTPVICNQLVSMIILAFLANLANNWLPNGKNLFSWFFFRCLSVLLAMTLHLIATVILQSLLPAGFMDVAPTVLLVILIIMMAVGALKLIIGAALAVISPIVGFLYTFFFANIVGKQITRSVLTTVILALVIYALESIGIATLSISIESLILYIPYGAGLLGLWYLCNRLF